MPLDYAPDRNYMTPGMLKSVTGLVPTVNGTYTNAPGPFLEGYGTPVASTDVIGSAVVKNSSGSALLYAGTTAKLFQSNGTTGWTDRSGAAYNASATGTWSFAQFSDRTLAANGVDKIQSSTGGAFADLAAAAPTAKIVVVHENAAVAFNTNTAPDGWYRSDTGDPTNWTVSAANDVDSGVLRGGIGGPVVAATVFGPMLIAWKTNAMYTGLFTQGAGGAADPKIRWDFAPGGKGIGCVGQHAFAETDIGIIFVSDRDIMLFDGGRPRSIAGKVRRNFFKSAVSRNQIFMTHNEVERNVFIWYAISGTYPTRALVYNYESSKWGELSYVSELVTANDYARCPVRNANYTDYTSVSGIATNSGLEANVVWVFPTAGTGARLANFAATKAQFPSGGPALTTGFVGDPAVDSSWSRIILVGGTSSVPTLASVAGTAITSAATLSTGNSFTGAVGADGHADIAVQARFMQPTLTFSTSGSIREIGDLVFEKTGGGRR